MSDLKLKSKPLHISSNPVPESPKITDPTSIATMTYSGPVPPPSFLVEYEKLVPGSAKKFLEATHIEAEHRRSLETMLCQEQIKLSRRGQIMAFSLASFCAMGSFVTIFLGYSIEGLGALLASIGIFVGVFIYARKRQ